jgi:hypothetical protein
LATYKAGTNCRQQQASTALSETCARADNPYSKGGDDDGTDDYDDGYHNDDDQGYRRGVMPHSTSLARVLDTVRMPLVPAFAVATAINANQDVRTLADDDYQDDSNDDHDDGGDDEWRGLLLHPPPSVSTTPLPAGANSPYSGQFYCAKAPKKRTVRFTATQVRSAVRSILPVVRALIFFLLRLFVPVTYCVQTIDGVGFSDYTDNKAAYEKTFKQAIASAITGATEDSVTNLVVTDPSATAAAARILSTASLRRLQGRLFASSSVVLRYTVVVTDTTLSVDGLMGELTSAVNSGAFTTAIQAYAVSNGAAGLETATSDSVTIESQGGDDGIAMSIGGIIGITLGGGAVLVAAIAATAVYCCSTKREPQITPQ